MTLVENSGFCFPRIVGIKEIMKIQLPAKKTKSCQCCIGMRISPYCTSDPAAIFLGSKFVRTGTCLPTNSSAL